MATPERLIVGLGNPGAEYASTRHNVGFMTLDAMASSVHAPPWQRKFKAQMAPATIGASAVLLLKPMTFMNLSGESVGEAMRYYKLEPQSVFVIHDDIDLQPGQIKVKQGGGNAGHNGLKSLDAHIGSNYWRVRLGVGRPETQNGASDYVLNSFAKADHVWLDPLLKAVVESFPRLMNGKPADFIRYVAETTKTTRQA